uniref:Uncharacterized protein n=1 Tax=Anopheles atroparvus TaxID=41427 RepID=A0AAG5DG97_ANOAO
RLPRSTLTFVFLCHHYSRLKRKSILSGSTASKRDGFPLALEFFNKENQQDPLGLRHTNIYDKDIFNFWTR